MPKKIVFPGLVRYSADPKVSGKPIVSEYYWCLHCERVFLASDWLAGRWHCPDATCDGSPLDCHAWESWDWPRSEHPEYPNTPLVRHKYPLYPVG